MFKMHCSNFHLIRSKTLLTNDFELTVPDLYSQWDHTELMNIYVTAAGLRAGNTRYTFVTAGVSPAVVRSGSSRHSVRYGDEYYFSTLIGRARTNLTERQWALFARYSSLWGCWPFGFLINVTRIIIKSGDRHQSGFGSGYGYPGEIQRKRKQRVCFIYKRISGGSQNGPRRELHGTIWKVRTAGRLLVEKTLNTGWGAVFKGTGRWHHATSLWSVRHLPEFRWRCLRHSPGNRRLHPQAMVPVPHVITMSRESVT